MPNQSQIVIVTGAAGNLGRATTSLLAARDACVVAVDRATGAPEAVVATLAVPTRHLAIGDIDLGEPAACEGVVARTLDRFGRIDGVVHTVGGFDMAPIAEAGSALWERLFRLNALTTVNMFRAAIAAMRPARRGSLVAIGAGAALKAPAGLAAYSASKSAVLRLVESFAEELKPEGIRVNAVLPATIDTPQNRATMPDADPSAWVTPPQLAEVIAFLISDAASGVTGALLPVAGRS
jgi:NAD(P)-dependent dehydrogenase (short-subunit alcohol dehydrogenase family)